MRCHRLILTALVLASVAAHGSPSYATAAETPSGITTVDQREVYCAAGDTCSFESTVSLEKRTTKTSLRLESATVPKNTLSSVDAKSGFNVVVQVPAKTRSMSVSFTWNEVTGSASVIGGSLLTGFNQVYVILNATSAGCTGCTVFPDDGSGPDGSGNAILLASSTKPTGTIENPSPTRTVTVKVARGYLPSSLTFSSYFITNSYLSEPGRAEASHQGQLGTISISSSS